MEIDLSDFIKLYNAVASARKVIKFYRDEYIDHGEDPSVAERWLAENPEEEA